MNFDSVWKRIKDNFEIKNYAHLAKIIETTSSNVSKKKQKNEFPIEWAYILAEKYNVTTEWILTGNNQENKELIESGKNTPEEKNFLKEKNGEDKEEEWVECYWNRKFVKKVHLIKGGLYEVDPINPAKKKMRGERVIIIDIGFVGPTVCLRIDSNWHFKKREYVEMDPCDLKLISKEPNSEEVKKKVLDDIKKYEMNKE